MVTSPTCARTQRSLPIHTYTQALGNFYIGLTSTLTHTVWSTYRRAYHGDPAVCVLISPLSPHFASCLSAVHHRTSSADFLRCFFHSPPPPRSFSIRPHRSQSLLAPGTLTAALHTPCFHAYTAATRGSYTVNRPRFHAVSAPAIAAPLGSYPGHHHRLGRRLLYS